MRRGADCCICRLCSTDDRREHAHSKFRPAEIDCFVIFYIHDLCNRGGPWKSLAPREASVDPLSRCDTAGDRLFYNNHGGFDFQSGAMDGTPWRISATTGLDYGMHGIIRIVGGDDCRRDGRRAAACIRSICSYRRRGRVGVRSLPIALGLFPGSYKME